MSGFSEREELAWCALRALEGSAAQETLLQQVFDTAPSRFPGACRNRFQKRIPCNDTKPAKIRHHADLRIREPIAVVTVMEDHARLTFRGRDARIALRIRTIAGTTERTSSVW
jgi:hypothetical protein